MGGNNFILNFMRKKDTKKIKCGIILKPVVFFL